MFKLLRFLKGYEKESIIGPLFKFLEACFELIVPLLMAEVIDVGIRNRDTAYIWKMCGVMLLMGLLGFLCSVTAQYFAGKGRRRLRGRAPQGGLCPYYAVFRR